MSSVDSFFSDPISYALAAKEQALQSQVGFAVQATSLNTMRQLGAAMVELIDAAGQLGKELGKGTQFDAVA